jgi:hypothetical protein
MLNFLCPASNRSASDTKGAFGSLHEDEPGPSSASTTWLVGCTRLVARLSSCKRRRRAWLSPYGIFLRSNWARPEWCESRCVDECLREQKLQESGNQTSSFMSQATCIREPNSMHLHLQSLATRSLYLCYGPGPARKGTKRPLKERKWKVAGSHS